VATTTSAPPRSAMSCGLMDTPPTVTTTLGACGSGGTVKDGVIEIQGDHAERLVALLQAQGHAARRAGG
jgi:hypothetical protein